MKKIYNDNKLKLFTKNRERFENFIYKYDYIIDQINRNARSSKKSAKMISELYYIIIQKFDNNKSEAEILQYILSEYPNIKTVDDSTTHPLFHSNLKNATYISAALNNVLRCPICGGAIHTNSTSMDHINRKREGGSDCVTNTQITHPYCNTGYKN